MGNPRELNMLRLSILSCVREFGECAHIIVVTETAQQLRDLLRGYPVEIR